jgi:hypothetical protein
MTLGSPRDAAKRIIRGESKPTDAAQVAGAYLLQRPERRRPDPTAPFWCRLGLHVWGPVNDGKRLCTQYGCPAQRTVTAADDVIDDDRRPS